MPKPSIGHVVATYLKQTQNWIYSQIAFQPDFPATVLALERENAFPLANGAIVAIDNDCTKLGLFAERLTRKFLTGYYPTHFSFAKQRNVGLLHAHFGHTGLNTLKLAGALGVPLVTSYYGHDMSVDKKGSVDLSRRYKPLFAQCSLFLVEGPAAKQTLVDLGCPAEKIEVHRLGIDLDRIKFVDRNRPENTPVNILMAATFTEKKGFPYGVEAFCQAAWENPQLQLTIIGDARKNRADEQEIKEQLEHIVAYYGCEEKVDFLGFVPLEKLSDYAAAHDIFLHPSVTAKSGDSEGGSPVVITEMAASGMPIIATRHCDIPRVVEDGVSGFLAPEREIVPLKKALLDLAENPALRKRMGSAGRKLVHEKFCAKKQGRSLAEIYKRVMHAAK